MKESEPIEVGTNPEVSLHGFALADCVVEIDRASAKYLRAVHRTALELATPNCFGAEIGGFWIMQEQLIQLRRLPDFYPLGEAPLVSRVVEAYVLAQTEGLYGYPNSGIGGETRAEISPSLSKNVKLQSPPDGQKLSH